MGLLTIIRKSKMKEREIRVLFLGLDNAGKSSLLCTLTSSSLKEVAPTLGFDIKTIDWLGKFKLHVWDVGGQETIRTYWRNYFEETDALVWVVDSADVARLQLCAEQLRQVLFEERLLGASLLIFANKQDLPGALSAIEIEQVLKLEDLGTRHWEIRSCSAVTGEGVIEGMTWMVNDATERVFKHEDADDN